MNVNGSFNAGFVQYTLWTWNKCSVYFCKTEIVISIWQHFRSEERQTFKNVQNQFIFKNSLLTKYFWYKLVQSFVKSRFLVLNSVRFEWMRINSAVRVCTTQKRFNILVTCWTATLQFIVGDIIMWHFELQHSASLCKHKTKQHFFEVRAHCIATLCHLKISTSFELFLFGTW